jgi:cytoskeletal protein CcmA (bactofilin family)
MASGSASYAVSATNYGRNSADSYFVLSAPDVINGSLEVTGNLRVDGTSRLVGAVTCDGALTAAGAVTAGSVSTAGNVNCAAVTASGAVNAATLSVSAASVLAGVTAQAVGCTSVTASGSVSAASVTTPGAVSAASLTTTGAVTAGQLVTAPPSAIQGGLVTLPTFSFALANGANQELTILNQYFDSGRSGQLSISVWSNNVSGQQGYYGHWQGSYIPNVAVVVGAGSVNTPFHSTYSGLPITGTQTGSGGAIVQRINVGNTSSVNIAAVYVSITLLN